jgi:hypothetical protein
MNTPPHSAMADFFPSDSQLLDLSDYDSDDDRFDFVGLPAHASKMFSPEIWRKLVFETAEPPTDHSSFEPE